MKQVPLRILAAIALASSLTTIPLSSRTASAAAPAQPHVEAGLSAAVATPTPGRQPGARFGNANIVSGRLAGLTAQAVQIQSFSGVQSIQRTAGTGFYLATLSSTKALRAGQNVTVRSFPSAAIPMVVTISPSGNLIGFVQTARSFGPGPSGTPRSGTPTRGNGNPANRRFVAPVAGTVTGILGTQLTVKTAQGKSTTFTMSSTTVVYAFSKVPSSAIKAGSQVSVTTETSDGRKIAVAVTFTTIANATAFLTTNS
jgi:hypothetical protein